MIALLDSDIIAYRCAASANNDSLEVAEFRTNDMMNRILHETNAESFIGYLSGGNNFRYSIYPEYKANRKDVPKPVHLEAVKELLIKQWKCKVTDGIEADDALGIDQDENTVICSIDKDLLQIPGKHYNFVKQEWATVSPMQGLRHFYGQIITGDATDNIPAFDGKLRNKVPIFVQKLIDPLQELMYEIEMYDYVVGVYEGDLDRLHRNAQLLYIQKKEGDAWRIPITTESGQEEGFMVLSEQHCVMLPDDGLPSTTL